jgi:hypothetical protein
MDSIVGLWKAIASEREGEIYTAGLLAGHCHLLLLPDRVFPGADGIWGEIRYDVPLSRNVVEGSILALRRLVTGSPAYQRVLTYPIFSGGLVYLGTTPEGIDTIDLLHYTGPKTPRFEEFRSRGIFRSEGRRLTICLANHPHERPSAFQSGKSSRVSLTVYVADESGAALELTERTPESGPINGWYGT